MKRVLAICLALAVLSCLSITAFADPGSFVKSPSYNDAPEVEKFDPADDGCTAQLIITPYSKRDTLPEDRKDRIEDAYKEIVGTDDLTDLSKALEDLAKEKGIDGNRLAVSDLFDARIEGCQIHEDHIGYEIILEMDTLEGFVGLMGMDENGNWILIEAEVINDGTQLRFSVESLHSPLAVVVDTGETADSPFTGDSPMIFVYAIIMAISALAVVVIAIKYRKQTA